MAIEFFSASELIKIAGQSAELSFEDMFFDSETESETDTETKSSVHESLIPEVDMPLAQWIDDQADQWLTETKVKPGIEQLINIDFYSIDWEAKINQLATNCKPGRWTRVSLDNNTVSYSPPRS